MFLITGASGQLGQNLKKILNANSSIFLSKKQLDITNATQLKNFFITNKVSLVINCAAYTDVEKAELNPELCNKVNIEGIKNLAKLSGEFNFLIIHISTDYVYDGCSSLPYKESDAVNPVSLYGKSKLQGELELLSHSKRAIVIRTSWLYSEINNNFFTKILSLSKNNKKINVISDQIGTPTYAYDLALIINEIINQIDIKTYNKKEIYNFSNEGVASWYDFAYEIIKQTKISCKLIPIKAKDYQGLAKRPNYSVLDKDKIKLDFNIEIRHWKEGISECIQIKN